MKVLMKVNRLRGRLLMRHVLFDDADGIRRCLGLVVITQ